MKSSEAVFQETCEFRQKRLENAMGRDSLWSLERHGGRKGEKGRRVGHEGREFAPDAEGVEVDVKSTTLCRQL